MLEWFRKKLLTVKEKTPPEPKCDICALNATNYMKLEFKSLDLDELTDALIRLCDGCKEEVLDKYNNSGLPAPIIKWNKEE